MAENPPTPDQTFVEQAEYLQPDDLLRWSAQHPNEKEIIKKLSLSGAKLITGPRGCGKTTLLLKAYYTMGRNEKSESLPIYVNYKISLKLEPLYTDRASATFWFKQWLLAKIYLGLYESLNAFHSDLEHEISKSIDYLKTLVSDLELGKVSNNQSDPIEVWNLADDIDALLKRSGRTRCVLLLDDAAHAFSAQQQRDFFELYRQLKSRNISPKAAIYPGVTHIPGFQGHDAEEVNVWIDPYSSEYLEFMRNLVSKRVPENVFEAFMKKEDYFNLACYSAFGMPRALLNMIRKFYSIDEELLDGSKVQFNFKEVLSAIREGFHNTVSVFDSLRIKLPIYGKFVYSGHSMLGVIYSAIKTYNQGKSRSLQSVTVALRDDTSQEIQRVFGFFQYAGIVRFSGKVSRGEKGTFLLYRIHIAGLVENNALIGAKAINAENYVFSLRHRNAHAFTRVSSSTLLKGRAEDVCLVLDLPPCRNCNTPRPSSEARFCPSCGQPFKDSSVFNSLSEQSVDLLSLTQTRVSRIREYSSIKTIKDVLMDHDGSELRKVPQIGPVWAKRIQSYAEEFIS